MQDKNFRRLVAVKSAMLMIASSKDGHPECEACPIVGPTPHCPHTNCHVMTALGARLMDGTFEKDLDKAEEWAHELCQKYLAQKGGTTEDEAAAKILTELLVPKEHIDDPLILPDPRAFDSH